jgi:hypothetical protein
MNTSTAASQLATEIAWQGSASDQSIAAIIERLELDIDAASVTTYAVEAGLLKPIPRLGGYTASRTVNAETFGQDFADWSAA